MSTINGNDNPNTLTGTTAADTINGKGGDDLITGGKGNDVMDGGEGNDTYRIAVGDGIDTFKDTGTTGTDTILATADKVAIGITSGFKAANGIEIIDAGGHSGVTITGGSGNDTFDFSSTTLIGITSINGNGGNDIITGSAGDDTMNGGAGNDTLNGGAGSDTYVVGTGGGIDSITDTGASGTDTILANADSVAIGLKSGLGAGNGIEVIDGGGHANVTITGSSGNDVLDFSSVILTDIAAINGGAGNDTITGSAAADVISGGPGVDILNGGEGGDTYQIGVGAGIDTITDTGATGTDTILATADNAAIGLKTGFSAANGIEVIDGGGHSGVTITGGAADDVFNFTGMTLTGIASINGGGGNDTLTGSGGADTLNGGAGNDTLKGGEGSDTYLYSTAAGVDTITDTGATGTDTILAAADNVAITLKTGFAAANGIEVIDSGGHAGVTLIGGAGNETFNFAGITLNGIANINGGAGNDTITGSSGDDVILGSGGNDTLTGGAGNDTINGGLGNDTMKGGADADLFVYAAGADKVSDFLHGTDHVDVSGTGVTDFTTLHSLGKQSGADTIFTFSAGNTLTLTGVTFSKLDASDFNMGGGNTPPTFTSGGTGTEAENTAATNVVYHATVSDPDGKAPVFSLDSGGDNAKFSINSSTGEVRFVSAPDFENPSDSDHNNTYNIVIHANDGTNDVTKAVTVSVTDVNDVAPTFTSGTTASEAENTAAASVVYQATSTDPDGGAPTYSLGAGGDNALFSIDAATGEVRFLSAPDYENPGDVGKDNTYNIVIHANDGVNDTTQSVAISVTNVNDVAPSFTSGTTASEAENTAAASVVYQAVTTDPDGGAPTYSLGAGGDNALFSIDAATGEVRFLSAPDYENPGDVGKDNTYNIVIHANDGVNDTTQSVAISVTNVNDVAPSFTSGTTATEAENTAASAVVYQAVTTDPDGGAPTYSLGAGGDNALFSIDAATGEVRFLSAPDYENPGDVGKDNTYNIVIHANDGVNETTQSVAISVTDVNDVAPTFTSGATASEAENTATSNVVYKATVTDPDGGTPVFSLDAGGDNAKFSINAATGEVKFLASPDFENPGDVGKDNTYNIVVHANDGVHDVTQAVAVSVTDLNDNPPVTHNDKILTNVALNTSFSLPEWALLANDTDADANTVLQISKVSGATGGTLGAYTATAGTSDTITFTDVPPANGSFTYTATDGAFSTTGTANVTTVSGSTVQGGAADEIVIGSSKDDNLYGGDGSNILFGGGGNDLIYGDYSGTTPASPPGNNTIDGGSGDDNIWGGLGNDTLTGGKGDDTVRGYSASFGDDPADGNDKITDTDGNNQLYGGYGDDTITAGAGSDTIDGGTGNDTIDAGDGNDSITADGNSDDANVDYIIAGKGDDTVTFYHYDTGDSADGGDGFDNLNLTLTSANDVFNAATQTNFLNFEQFNIAGGEGNDTITGSDNNDILWGDFQGLGNGGNDTLNGGKGDDLLYGGDGANTLNGGDGNDSIYGDYSGTIPSLPASDNIANGGDGNDTIFGGLGNDTLDGGKGDDTIYGYSVVFGDPGTDGNDTITDTDGNNNLNGGSGNDTITAGAGNDTIDGGDGKDTIDAGDGDNTVYGGTGNDTITAGSGNDYIVADTSGADSDIDHVTAGKGDDTVIFNHLDVGDTADGGQGFDLLAMSLTDGNDTFDAGNLPAFLNFEQFSIAGCLGNDVLTGGDNNDTLWGDFNGGGGGGNDTLNGGKGDDLLYGGDGANTLNGGDGNDSIYGDYSGTIPSLPASDNIANGGDGNDTIFGGLGNDTLDGGKGDDTIYGYSVAFGDPGTDGNDTIHGGEGNDLVFGGSGNDTIDLGVGNDAVSGDDGNDVLTMDTTSSTDTGIDQAHGNAGADIITFNHYDAGDNADGGDGNDTLNLTFGSDDDNSNSVIANFINFEQFNLHGGDGNDTLTGGSGIDQLFGDGGNDILIGGAGPDTLTGGTGTDTFKYTALPAGQDTITDFVHASDVIDVSTIDANTSKGGDQAFAFVTAQNSGTVANSITWFQDVGNNQTIIHADNNGNATADLTITLQGLVTVTATDFHL